MKRMRYIYKHITPVSMISVNEAITCVRANSKPSESTFAQELKSALGFTLVEDIVSSIDMPPFRQSAMDGYAVSMHDDPRYQLIGEIKAGDSNDIHLKPGQAVRIFTGAAVPDSANAIIIQEHVEVIDQNIHANSNPVAQQNIRPRGEQVHKNDIALPAGTKLTAAGIGFLASLGISSVKVYQKPVVGIVVTGNELVPPGAPLPMGKIYESNALMLNAALTNSGYRQINHYKVEDDYKLTLKTLRSALSENDMVLISGGISVGEYDYVGKALLELGVEQLFYKVRQKPGKPLFFGKNKNTTVFALPGNPGSALSCYYIYVLEALEKISGNTNYKTERIMATSRSAFSKKGERAQFLKAYLERDEVTILDGQNSSMLHTFALANALAYMPAEMLRLEKGESVAVIKIPN